MTELKLELTAIVLYVTFGLLCLGVGILFLLCSFGPDSARTWLADMLRAVFEDAVAKLPAKVKDV